MGDGFGRTGAAKGQRGVPSFIVRAGQGCRALIVTAERAC
jgi:hypothetical protein